VCLHLDLGVEAQSKQSMLILVAPSTLPPPSGLWHLLRIALATAQDEAGKRQDASIITPYYSFITSHAFIQNGCITARHVARGNHCSVSASARSSIANT